MIPRHNLDALLNGTAEFSFCEGALTAAEARAKGFLDFGNLKATTPSTEKNETVHKGSYRGRLIRDKVIRTERNIIYTLQAEEWEKNKLRLMFYGVDGTGHTQGALTNALADTLAFTVDAPSKTDRWYDVTSGGARLRQLTSVVLLLSGAGTACTGNASDDSLGSIGHGLAAGNLVAFTGTALPGGLSGTRAYYVVNPLADTFQVALTEGGVPINITSAGTSVLFYPALLEGTDYDLDLLLGRIQMSAAQNADITPMVNCEAITSEDAGYLNGIDALDFSQREVVKGIGRLIIYDTDAGNQVVMDHSDFLCEVEVDSSGAIDGTNFSELTLKVTVRETLPGKVWVRE